MPFTSPDGTVRKVYAARPYDCRHYVRWDQPDKTVYEFASPTQLSPRTVRRLERDAKAAK